MSEQPQQAGNAKLSSAKQALLERRLRNAKKGPAQQVIERRTTAGPIPLSFAQQRLWFLDQLEEGQSASYNVLFVWRMKGRLDEAALRRSLQEIVDRHESLRTTFVEQDGEPVQVIAPTLSLDIQMVDLQGLAEEEREPNALRLAREESEFCFPLASGPLIRVQLMRLSERDHQLVLNLHHIVSDGWSIGVFTKELASLYEAFSSGRPSPLEELAVQYGDFAVWQREWMQGEVLDKQLSYWKKQLGGTLPILQLPTDRPRPSKPIFKGEVQEFWIGKELLEELKALSQREGVTLFMTLLAAFNVLLHRYSGQDDILVATPVANRNRRELEGLIGFFVNTLVLRTDLSGEPAFRDLLQRVQRVALDGFLHQDVPFEKLVAELQPDRDLSQSPLFRVMFALQNASMPPLHLPDLTLQTVEVYNGTSKFDLFLNAVETEQGLMTSIEYSTDLYDDETMTRMMGHFKTLLAAIARRPETKVADLPLLGAAEQQTLLTEWNATAVVHREDAWCVHQLFEAQAERTPDAPAAVFGGEQLTYAELDAKASALAVRLQELGVGPDVRVGISMERSLGMIVAVLAALKAGGAYVPLDPGYPAERVAMILEDANAAVVITQEHVQSRLPEHGAHVICIDSLDDLAVAAGVGQRQPTAVTPDHLAYVIYTSGSTGKPKGVSMPHRPLVNLLLWQREDLAASGPARTLQFTSLNFDVSFQEIFSTWATGGTLVLVTEEERRDPEQLLRVLCEQEVQRLFLPFVALQQLAEAGCEEERVPGSLREVITAGEQLQVTRSVARFMERLPGAVLYNHYGPSETHVVTSCKLVGDPSLWPLLPPIGRAIHNVQLYVLDARLQPVPIGVPGELYVGGRALARGYLQRDDLTAERFLPDPFAQSEGGRLYKTGDLVRLLADGNVEYLGRIDQQVKIRGYRIEVGEVEAVVGHHPEVREAVVMPMADSAGGKRLVAYVVAQPGAAVRTEELRGFVKSKLPEYMIPSAFVALEALPLTPSGKVDRRALPAPEQEQSPAEGYLAPRNRVEEVLASVFADVLGLSRVGVFDDFFDLGGHSLLATRVISRIRKLLQADLPVRTLFEQPSVAQLAQVVQGDKEQEQAPCVSMVIQPIDRGQPLSLSYSQQRLWFIDQLQPGSPVYNMPEAWRLRGELCTAALEQALNTIRQRHETLRTTFGQQDGEAVQVIAPYAPVPLDVIELAATSEVEREAEIHRLMQAELSTPFDLQAGPLFRCRLIRCGEQEHVLLFNMHHIIFDGWSSAVFAEELILLYNALVTGAEDPLPALAVQYADYAQWQRDQWQSGAMEAGMEYWRGKLGGGKLPVLQVPTDRPRPAVQSNHGMSQEFTLPPELMSELKAWSQQNGATLYMTLLALFYTLLHRYSGQTDLVVGTASAGRSNSEVERTIGFFVNSLALRTDLSGDPTFAAAVARVRETMLDAYQHQDVPFVKLVEELETERNLAQSPMFQVMFLLQNTPGQDLQLEGLTREPVDGWEGTAARMDLTVSARETAEGLVGTVEYSTDLFDASTITRMFEQYRLLAEGAMRDAARPISSLPLLLESEREQLLIEWNDTAADYPDDVCLHQLFERQVAKTPDAVAVECEGEQLTYRELNQRANALARRLIAHGVGADVCVGLCVDRSIEQVVAQLGILKAGGAYVPLDPVYPLERLTYMLEHSGIRVLVTQQVLRDRFESYALQTVCLEETADECSLTEDLDSSVRPHHLAYVIYTSGSTGNPKVVQIEHRSVVNFVTALQQRLGASERDVLIGVASISFDMAVLDMYLSLCIGAKLVIVPREVLLDGQEMVKRMEQVGVTLMGATPVFWHMLIDAGWQGTPGLSILCGGEALSRELANALVTRCDVLWNLYGPTEATVYATCEQVHADESITIGKPIANYQVYVLDERLQPVPVGVAGELHIGGVGLMRGYFGRPDLTQERVVHSPSIGSDLPLYKTGDLARYLRDGRIEYLGRRDHQVKIRGYRIELGEIESLLAARPDVKEAVVLARDEQGEKRLVAYLVTADGEKVDAAQWRIDLKRHLPEFMIPSAFVQLDAFPQTPNGKVDRLALQEIDVQMQEHDQYVEPRTAAEWAMVNVWEQVLGISPVGVQDSFFLIGGDSLKAVKLINEVEKQFDVKLPLAALFQSPTVAGLCMLLSESETKADGRSLILMQKGSGAKPPVFLVHPIGGGVFCYAALAGQLGAEESVYGLQAVGYDAEEAPLTSIDELADRYLQEIIQAAPAGPYRLLGWSFGGTVAYEIARRLEERGETVQFLGLIDAARIGDGERLIPDVVLDDWDAAVIQYAPYLPQGVKEERTRRALEVIAAHSTAINGYRFGRPIRTDLHLFHVTDVSDEHPTDLVTPEEWLSATKGSVHAMPIPGDHHSLVRPPHVFSLGERIRTAMQERDLAGTLS